MTVEILGRADGAGLKIRGENPETLPKDFAARLYDRVIPENVVGTY